MSINETLQFLMESQGNPLYYFWGHYNPGGEIYYLSKEASDYISGSSKAVKKLEDLFYQPGHIPLKELLHPPEDGQLQWMPMVKLGPEGHPFILIYLKENESSFLFFAVLFSTSNLEYLLDVFGKFYNFDHFSQDFIITVSPGGIIQGINKNALRSLGFSKEELLGHSIEKILISPADLEEIIKRMEREHTINNLEICLRGRLGNPIGLAFIYGVRDLHGNLSKAMVFIRNITEQVETLSQYMRTSIELSQANDELKEAQTTLVNQEKMASIGLLAAGLAHEINNPLGYISNNMRVMEEYVHSYNLFIEDCAEKFLDTEEKRKVFDEIKEKHEIQYMKEDFSGLTSEINEGIQRISKLMDSLKVFSQKEKSSLSDYHDIGQALDSLIDLTYNEYKYDLEIRKEFREIPLAYCHLMSVNQALFNVFMNAVEAVKGQDREEMGWISISTYVAEDMVCIRFHDNGGGIPDTVLNRVKEPFFTTKKVGKGTGLGLSIAHEIIVEKHGGMLEIQNLQEGTEVILGLPLIHDFEGENE